MLIKKDGIKRVFSESFRKIYDSELQSLGELFEDAAKKGNYGVDIRDWAKKNFKTLPKMRCLVGYLESLDYKVVFSASGDENKPNLVFFDVSWA